MRRLATIGALAVALPSFVFAHVSVRPRESRPGVEEKYTVRVPTEGTVATTHVRLEIPASVTVLEVLPHDGATFETAKQGDRITAITWKKEIPAKAVASSCFGLAIRRRVTLCGKLTSILWTAPPLTGSASPVRSGRRPSPS